MDERIKELLKKLEEKTDIRQTLSELRQEIKDPEKKRQVTEWLENKKDLALSFLNDSDAKIRKNIALIMGASGIKEFLKPLYEAYEKEQQMFVKSSYLQAIMNFDYREYADKLKNKAEELVNSTPAKDAVKHIEEEFHVLTDMLAGIENEPRHTFTGYNVPSEVMLMTVGDCRDVIVRELTEKLGVSGEDMTLYPSGIQLNCSNLNELMKVRTFSEICFLVPGMKNGEFDPEILANKVASSGLMTFLRERYRSSGVEKPFLFRVELKSKLSPEKKLIFIRKFTTELEKRSDKRLLNSVTKYEIEIRLVRSKSGNCNMMVKLMGLQDNRFSYRKEYEPVSIKPVNAAILVAAAKDYMVPDAQVLDPFCGVGTLLIERQKAIKANTSYGIDILGSAIDKARNNTIEAGQIVHYINRDFFDFEHDYLFDEIFTDMPFTMREDKEQIKEIYDKFFVKARTVMKREGTVIMYAHDPEFVENAAIKGNFHIVAGRVISEKEGTKLYILKQN